MGSPTALPLDEYANVTLNASGAGQVTFSTPSGRVTWVVEGVSVSVSSNTNEPTAVLYHNGLAGMIAGTSTGSNDSIGGLNLTVRNGFLMIQWLGGDAGAIASAHLTGSVHIGG